MNSIVAGLGGWIVAVISAGGYLGVAALMAAESACLPLPSEIIMPFAGYLASTGRFSLVLVATAGAIGCNLGSAVAYAVGASGGRALALRWGRYVMLSPAHLDRADWFFHRFGGPAVFIARLLPMVRTFIALPAGIARMPQIPFHIYTFVGSWPWCYALAYIGYVLGKKWNTDPRLHAVMRGLDVAAMGLIAAGVVSVLVAATPSPPRPGGRGSPEWCRPAERCRLASVSSLPGQVTIKRQNHQRMVAITGRLHGCPPGAAVSDVDEALAQPGIVPPGIRFEPGGASCSAADRFAGLTGEFGAALVADSVPMLAELGPGASPLRHDEPLLSEGAPQVQPLPPPRAAGLPLRLGAWPTAQAFPA